MLGQNCPACGSGLEPGANFCSSCGAGVASPADGDTTAGSSSPPVVPRVEPAGRWQRFFNLVIDNVTFVVILIFTAPLWQEAGSFNQYLFNGLIVLVYYLVLEATTGRTVGKLITGTRVVDARGEKPTFKQILGRTFARFIPLEALSFLGSPRGWHDSLSNTYVVSTR